MPFKRKPYKKVGTKDWEVYIPTPPKFATHARLTLLDDLKGNGKPKVATLPIKDFGCFKGVQGDFHYLRMDNRGKIHEIYSGKWYWNGKEVDGIDELMKT